MRNRATRPIAAILAVLLLAAIPAQAGPIPFGDVVQVFSGLQNGNQTQELRLRSVSQSSSTPVSGDVKGSTSTQSSSQQQQGGQQAAPVSLISTAAGPQEGQQGNVETVQEGDVTGTVCDCGELIRPGFKFPWFALAGVPLICATGICHKDKKCVGDCCEGNCGQIPEPGTLFLLGSGLSALGASMRRRYRLRRAGRDLPNTTEV